MRHKTITLAALEAMLAAGTLKQFVQESDGTTFVLEAPSDVPDLYLTERIAEFNEAFDAPKSVACQDHNKRGKYLPHQGKRERERRARRLSKNQTCPQNVDKLES